LGAIAIGIGYCARSSPLRRVLTRGFAFGIAGAAFSALLPSLVRDRLHGTEIIYGLCLAAFGAGSIFAALWVGEARKRWGSDRVVSIASLVFAAAMIPAATALTLPPLLATAFVAGAAWVSTLTTLNVAMQLRSPEEILGRCLSIYQAVTFGAMALGAWLLGTLADLTDLPTALFTAAGWLTATGLLLPLIAPMPRRDDGRVIP